MILYGQVWDTGGAEDRAPTFPSAKLAVACGHVHGMGEWQSCEISYFNPSGPQNKLLQHLVRQIFPSSVPQLKFSTIFLLQTVTTVFKPELPPSSDYDPKPLLFQKPPPRSKPLVSQPRNPPFLQPQCYHLHIYKHWNYPYKRDQGLLASEKSQITVFPTMKYSCF